MCQWKFIKIFVNFTADTFNITRRKKSYQICKKASAQNRAKALKIMRFLGLVASQGGLFHLPENTFLKKVLQKRLNTKIFISDKPEFCKERRHFARIPQWKAVFGHKNRLKVKLPALWQIISTCQVTVVFASQISTLKTWQNDVTRFAFFFALLRFCV